MAAARSFASAILVILAAAAPAASAQEVPAHPPVPAPEPPSAEGAKKPGSGCRGESPPGAAGIDEIRAGIHRGVCITARFVDRLFGDDNEYSVYED